VRTLTPFTLLIFIVLLLLFPLFFGQFMVASLVKLHLSPAMAGPLVIAIILGGLVNIPIARLDSPHEVAIHPLAVYGLPRAWPRMSRAYRQIVVALNLGGCVIPTGLALYELASLAASGAGPLLAAVIATAVNCAVCYRIAQPIPGIGIGMPGFIPPLVAAAMAILLGREHAPQIAFIAGVAGPLIGADLFHLRGFLRSGAGLVSIGGAGTFDGIVLSGIVAAYLA
jgi:uncharacterized membrane protein